MAESGDDDLDEFLSSPNFVALQKSIVRSIVRSLLEQGVITVDDVEDGSYAEKLKALIVGGVEIAGVTDHTEQLLRKARRAREKNKQDALLHYAMFIEHKLNAIIDKLARRSQAAPEAAAGLMRELRLSSKATWALELVGGKSFDVSTVNLMTRIAEARNAYVHYKWTSWNDAADSQLPAIIAGAESVVQSIKSYENQYFYDGRRSKIDNALKSI